MKLLTKRKQGGFTIIEVMIVLAIAGLIMAVVFYAVPQLRRSADDNSRRNLATRVKSELENYASNNQGTYPFSNVSGTYANCTSLSGGSNSCSDWYSRYITGGNVNIVDPSGATETINVSTSAAAPTWAKANLWISVGNKCAGETPTVGSGGGASARTYALLIALDRTNTYYCIDNG